MIQVMVVRYSTKVSNEYNNQWYKFFTEYAVLLPKRLTLPAESILLHLMLLNLTPIF